MQTIDGGCASDPKPTQNTLEEVGAATLSWLFMSRDAYPLKASLLSQTVRENDVRRWGGGGGGPTGDNVSDGYRKW